MRVDPAGKPAATVFHVREYFPRALLAEAELLSGRTHQIRVHAAHLGCPLAGDAKYGDRQAEEELGDIGLKRLFLHAAELEIAPIEGVRACRFSSPLPSALESVLIRLRQQSLTPSPP